MNKNVNQIFDEINQNYNLQLLSTKENSKEIEAIKRKIRRNLHNLGLNPPYNEITPEIETKLFTPEFKNYLLKKSAKTNHHLNQDQKAFTTMKQNKLKDNTSYEEALKNIMLEYIFQQTLKNSNEYFLENNFKKDYQEYRKHIDNTGLPMPGYTESKNKLHQINNFFINDTTLKPTASYTTALKLIEKGLTILQNSDFSNYITKNDPSHPEDVSTMLNTIKDAINHLKTAAQEYDLKQTLKD